MPASSASHVETRDSLLMVLNLCNNFLGPLSDSLRAVRRIFQTFRQAASGAGIRAGAIEEAAQLLDTSIWQIERLNQAWRGSHAAHLPPAEPMDGTEPIAAAVYGANTISYNIRPPVVRFNAPAEVDGVRSWEALRQPVNYLVYMKSGDDGDWLCRVVCDAKKVRLEGLRSGLPIDIATGKRFRWLGRNAEVTLRSGVRSYVVVFVQDENRKRRPEMSKDDFAASYNLLLNTNWSRTAIERYFRYHGELPEVRS